MSPELIAAIAAGLVAVISAIATAQSKRTQRQTDELAYLRARNRELRDALRDADRWSGQLLRIIDRAGLHAPAHPSLDQDDADDQYWPSPGDGYLPAPGRGGRRAADHP